MSNQKPYTEEEKMNYVAEFKASGMSINEYTKEIDILESLKIGLVHTNSLSLAINLSRVRVSPLARD